MDDAARAPKVAVVVAEQLEAIYEQFGVPQTLRDFLTANGVTTVDKLAASVSEEARIGPDIIEASGGTGLTLGDKGSVRLAWSEARKNSGVFSSSGSAATSASAGQSITKMPAGSEARLRDLWFKKHSFNLGGAWLITEGEMAKVYAGLQATPKYLFIPDVMSIVRRCDLQQKPKKGQLITEDGVQPMNYTVSPCTTHPEFFLRIRAFIMTICWLSIATPMFLTYETALDVCEYIFDSINCRPDGKRPSLESLTAVYFAMFGEYAKQLQNQGTVLEDWLLAHVHWQHFWKESIAHWENVGPREAVTLSAGNSAVPSDLAAMHGMLKGLQSSIHRLETGEGARKRRNQHGGGQPHEANLPKTGKADGGNGTRKVSADDPNRFRRGKRQFGNNKKGGGKK